MTRLKALLTICVFVFIYAVYYWAVPLVVNIQNRVPQIETYVKKEMGMQFDVKNPSLKMGLIPSIWVDADSFDILDKTNKPFSVKNPKLKIRLLPLLFGKFELAYFSCDQISAKFKIDKNNKFYIGDYLIEQKTNQNFSIENSRMNVQNYNIKIKDEARKKNILLAGYYFDLEKYNSKKYINFSTDSNITINNHTSIINTELGFKLPLKKTFDVNDIVFDGTITNLNLGDFSPYIQLASKNKIHEIKGNINIKASTKKLPLKANRITVQTAIDKLFIEGEAPNAVIKSNNKINILTVADISKNTLVLKKNQISSNKLNFSITGKISKINSKNPNLNLEVEVKNSRTENFVALVPPINFQNAPCNVLALKKYGFYADINGKIRVTGKSKSPFINGDFTVTNGYIIKPLSIPKATVKFKFLGNKFYMDIVVPTSAVEKVIVKGTAELYGQQNSNLDISSTHNVNLKLAESILNPLQEILSLEFGPLPIMKIDGTGNIKLKTSGNAINPKLFGVFNFKNTTASFNGVGAVLKNGEGSLYFNNQETHFVTRKATLDNKPIKVDGKCSLNGDLDYDVTANGQNAKSLTDILKSSPRLMDIKLFDAIKNIGGKVNIKIKLKGKVDNIANFILGKTVIVSGYVKLLGNNILIDDLPMEIKNLYGDIKFKNDDVDFKLYSLLGKSKIYINGKSRNNNITSKIKLDNIAFAYSNIPVKIYSGYLELNHNKLTLYKINAIMDSMPILIDGFVTNIFNKPKFNLYINSKPTQKFIEKYYNKDSLYPLKIKGDIIYSSRIQGTNDLFNTKTEINLQEDSNIYYMGATLGDVNNPIRIFLDTNVYKDSVYVNNFQYDKLISSQNNKEFISPQLNAKGQINFDKHNIDLKNFVVKTQNPTDAKIFNMLFKKSLIKQGLFSSNITLNGPIITPKIFGNANFTGINMPILDTTIKDISLDFDNKLINIKTKGEVFSNSIVLFATMQNRLQPPFVLDDVDIYLGNLDINEIAKSLNKLQIETNMQGLVDSNKGLDIFDFVIKNAHLKADSVFVKNVFAKDLTADFSLNEKLLFELNNFKFGVADGTVNGNFKYNFLNSKSSLKLHAANVNANSVTDALFDLPNQIFGLLSGDVDLTCNGKTHRTCMTTLSGGGNFVVSDGKMPKLGSMEYLLKAANLVKSGLTGLTINSIIDMVTPLKTGNFDNINGSFAINSGIADSIQIFSKGKDLSLYLKGTYNFSTPIADMEIYGMLAKKVTTILGPVGNTSLNTLFNTIPGLNLDENNKADFIKNLSRIPGFELNDKKYRVFSVKVYGDINGDNYVQSFKWIE